MHDTSTRPTEPLPADLAAAATKIAPGTPQSPLLPSASKPKATSRQKKAALAAMKPEERRSAEAARKAEAALARAEARLAQHDADVLLLHEHGRCVAGCPLCSTETFVEIGKALAAIHTD
jgi:hypothetical protein